MLLCGYNSVSEGGSRLGWLCSAAPSSMKQNYPPGGVIRDSVSCKSSHLGFKMKLTPIVQRV